MTLQLISERDLPDTVLEELHLLYDLAFARNRPLFGRLPWREVYLLSQYQAENRYMDQLARRFPRLSQHQIARLFARQLARTCARHRVRVDNWAVSMHNDR